MNLKARLRRILGWTAAALTIVGCCALTIWLATGAWKGLVAVVAAILEQGPAAIISSVIAGYVTSTCIIPVLVLVGIVALIAWSYS